MNTITLLLTAMLASFSLAQTLAANTPATVYFTPYKLANCSMSTDIASEDLPSSYPVTTGRCYNSTYEFLSYAQATNFNAANIPCAFTIHSQVDCMGDSIGANLSNCLSCFLGPMSIVGQSFQMSCGP